MGSGTYSGPGRDIVAFLQDKSSGCHHRAPFPTNTDRVPTLDNGQSFTTHFITHFANSNDLSPGPYSQTIPLLRTKA